MQYIYLVECLSHLLVSRKDLYHFSGPKSIVVCVPVC